MSLRNPSRKVVAYVTYVITILDAAPLEQKICAYADRSALNEWLLGTYDHVHIVGNGDSIIVSTPSCAQEKLPGSNFLVLPPGEVPLAAVGRERGWGGLPPRDGTSRRRSAATTTYCCRWGVRGWESRPGHGAPWCVAKAPRQVDRQVGVSSRSQSLGERDDHRFTLEHAEKPSWLVAGYHDKTECPWSAGSCRGQRW